MAGVMVKRGLKPAGFWVFVNVAPSGVADAGMAPLSCCYYTDKLLLTSVWILVLESSRRVDSACPDQPPHA
jgi:hypothetical protein